jgi:hypothetical protein
MKRLESQSTILRKHLEAGKSIAPLQALNKFGIYRLASRINDLRNEGLNIVTEMVNQHPVKFAKYKLVKK